MQRFSLTTLGCKVNQYDGNAISLLLRRTGWRRAGAPEAADLIVINTCCVTTTAMRKSRQAIRKAIRNAPHAAVLVVGCYSDYDTRRLQNLLSSVHVPPNRAMIAGHHGDLPSRIETFLFRISGQPGDATISAGIGPARQPGSGRNDVCMTAGCLASNAAVSNPTSIKTRRKALVKGNMRPGRYLNEIDRFEGHQRAFVKVQDGCDAFCSYCIVPYTRCRLWSKTIELVEAECGNLVAAGHKEIVLTGVFLGAFGRQTAIRRRWPKNEPSKLPNLLARVAQIDGLWRVRLSSLEPPDVTDELLAVCRNTPNFAPHFHLPLQSGSQRILQRMNRQYTAEEFRRTVESLHETLDRPAITTDIILGFPGETDDDFAATLDVARYAGFSKIHAFPFSAIEPTVAWRWRHEAAPPETVRRRMTQLAELERELTGAYRRQFVGEVMEGLVERTRTGPDGFRQAMTDRYLRINFVPPRGQSKQLTGKIVRLRITQDHQEGLRGELAECL